MEVSEMVENDLMGYQDLVFKFAHKYGNLMSRGYEFDDLVQEGWEALLKAKRGFDGDYGISFITYAYACLNNKFIDIYNSDGNVDKCDIDEVDVPVDYDYDCSVDLKKLIESLSEDARKIIEFMLIDTGPKRYSKAAITKYWNRVGAFLGIDNISEVRKEIALAFQRLP